MPSASRLRARSRHARRADVARHVHDLLVHERALAAQPVRPAHVAVVGREDHDRVVVRAACSRAHRAPCRATRRPAGAASRSSRGGAATTSCRRGRCSPTCRAAGPSATAVASRACRAGRRRSWRAASSHTSSYSVSNNGSSSSSFHFDISSSCSTEVDLVRVRGIVVVGGLVDREPHHVVRVHQRDGEEPRLRRASPRSCATTAAAFDAMIGSKCTPVPAQPMK